MRKLLFIIVLFACSLPGMPQQGKTTVTIKGEDFYINDVITLAGKRYNGMRLEGLLPNSRMVQGIFDDYNPETKNLWAYSDTKKWDADRNTNEFIAAMSAWKEHGMLAFTLNLQGGSPFGYSGSKQTWVNSAFTGEGALDPAYMNRLKKILDRADALGMVVIVGYFYFGQDQNLKDEGAVVRATRDITHWILEQGYRNVLVEVNNECDINNLATKRASDPLYQHAILDAARVHELISLVKSIEKEGRRLLVSTSFIGGSIPTDNVLNVADFVLLHGNSVSFPDTIAAMVKTVRAKPAYRGAPIVFNEDDHFDFDKSYNHFLAATSEHASWGYFDYRMKDETFVDGYQSVPVDWGINSQRKKAFFGLLRKMTR